MIKIEDVLMKYEYIECEQKDPTRILILLEGVISQLSNWW